MKIIFYGTRGSIPTPLTLKEYIQKMKNILNLYSQSEEKDVDLFIKKLPFNLSHICGGNTACVSIKENNFPVNEHIIIDAGSGLRVLGNEFIGKSNNVFHIFLSHYHWDHICGIPFFKPIYNPKDKIIFYSPFPDMLANLQRQQHPVHFPMPFDKLPSQKETVVLKADENYKLHGFNIKPVALKHPGTSYAYIFDGYGKKVSYISDGEFTSESIVEKEEYYKKCFKDSDIAIMDSQYDVVEFFNKFDWGHTSSNMDVNLALDWNIKKLVMFHFDPDHSDEDLLKILREAKEQKDFLKNKKLEVLQAVEGSYLDI